VAEKVGYCEQSSAVQLSDKNMTMYDQLCMCK